VVLVDDARCADHVLEGEAVDEMAVAVRAEQFLIEDIEPEEPLEQGVPEGPFSQQVPAVDEQFGFYSFLPLS